MATANTISGAVVMRPVIFPKRALVRTLDWLPFNGMSVMFGNLGLPHPLRSDGRLEVAPNITTGITPQITTGEQLVSDAGMQGKGLGESNAARQSIFPNGQGGLAKANIGTLSGNLIRESKSGYISDSGQLTYPTHFNNGRFIVLAARHRRHIPTS
ncbi:MAG: hypothetical protein OHK0023_25290 [Anaerolineae bacterium]